MSLFVSYDDYTIAYQAIENSKKTKLSMASLAQNATTAARDYYDLARDLAVSDVDYAVGQTIAHHNYVRANKDVYSRLATQYTALTSMKENMNKFGQNLAQFLSNTRRPNQLTNAIKPLAETIQMLLNTSDATGYAFSGTKTDVPPVQNATTASNLVNGVATANYYQGNEDVKTALITDTQTLAWGVNADNPVFQNFFAAYNLALQADKQQDNSLAKQASAALSQATNGLASLIATSSGNMAQLQSINKLHTNQELLFDEQAKKLVSVDQPDVLQRLSLTTTMLQSSNYVTSKLLSLSSMLIDRLR